MLYFSRRCDLTVDNWVRILILLLLLNLNYTNIYAIEADVFVQSTVNRATETLGGGLTKEERMNELKKIALDTVDIRGIGYYSLGVHRKSASDEQKNEYEKAYIAIAIFFFI